MTKVAAYLDSTHANHGVTVSMDTGLRPSCDVLTCISDLLLTGGDSLDEDTGQKGFSGLWSYLGPVLSLKSFIWTGIWNASLNSEICVEITFCI